MNSLADGLPPEIAQQIHPDGAGTKRVYWNVRDQLLEQFSGEWIGFADGAVIASGTSSVEVFHRAQASGRHAFVTCVGHENEPTQMRRCSFPYDTTYPAQALPVISVEFRPLRGTSGILLIE